MTKKTVVLEMTIDEAALNVLDGKITTVLGLTNERADFLIDHLSNKTEQMPWIDGKKRVNGAAEMWDFLCTEPLTGNEILFLIYMGYTAKEKMKAILAQAERNPLARLMAAISEADNGND